MLGHILESDDLSKRRDGRNRHSQPRYTAGGNDVTRRSGVWRGLAAALQSIYQHERYPGKIERIGMALGVLDT
jgi:hypothetical protein